MTLLSADLHPTTKSRPLYRPLTPDPSGRAHLIVTDGAVLPEPLRVVFASAMAEVWIGTDLARLARHLDVAATGLRLYAIGDEAFLWEVVAVGRIAGLGDGEIALWPHGIARRRAQCIHCKALFDVFAEPVCRCPGCGLDLLVREHFSQRLGAFQAVATHGATRGETFG